MPQPSKQRNHSAAPINQHFLRADKEIKMADTFRSDPANAKSRLLSQTENLSIGALAGRRSTSLATTVVQVFFASAPDRNKWKLKYTAIACFVKDNLKRSYFIRIVDVVNNCMLWEQELYSTFTYSSPRPYFHTFESDDCNVGLNFADRSEADLFKVKVDEKIALRQQKKIEKKGRHTVHRPSISTSSSNVLAPINENQPQSPRSPSPIGNDSAATPPMKRGKSKKKKNNKLSKTDIGTPMDFRHVGHVGWDPKGGFDVNNIDPQWRKLFDTVGINESHLQDKETSQFIYDFVESHGGIEKATKELESQMAPPPPSRGAPGPPSRSAPLPPPPGGLPCVPPPPPPSRGAPPPPGRSGEGPPPPPPSRVAPRLPTGRPGANPPPPPPSQRGFTGAAPPPPPPPPVGVPAPPPPPGPGDSGASESTPVRGGLLSQIHKGMQLKKASETAAPASRSVSAEDNGDEDEPLGMAGALQRALLDRSKFIHSSDDDDDDEEGDDFDDEDWSE